MRGPAPSRRPVRARPGSGRGWPWRSGSRFCDRRAAQPSMRRAWPRRWRRRPSRGGSRAAAPRSSPAAYRRCRSSPWSDHAGGPPSAGSAADPSSTPDEAVERQCQRVADRATEQEAAAEFASGRATKPWPGRTTKRFATDPDARVPSQPARSVRPASTAAEMRPGRPHRVRDLAYIASRTLRRKSGSAAGRSRSCHRP